MRDLKFRQPIFNGDKFHSWHYWGFVGDHFSGPDLGTMGRSIEGAHKNSQQFTGLLDKNGKEIFEGDILHEGFYGNLEVRFGGDGGGESIGFYLMSVGGRTFGLMGFTVPLEIVGNIHENPDML